VRAKLNKSPRFNQATIKAERKKDALAMAELIYDIYKEKQDNDKIENGQNDANKIKDN
jgi:hypothetical protein